ncbi:hypothetical protein GCM10009534_03290 [Kribbella sandramycini]
MVEVQVRQPDRVEPVERRVPKELGERAGPGVDQDLGTARAQQVARARAVRQRVGGGRAEDRERVQSLAPINW